jgi:hypothetical protein
MELNNDDGADGEPLDPIKQELLDYMLNTRPGDYKWCPTCKKKFDIPDMRERDDDPTIMDYHCPLCGYHYARWHKTKTPTDLIKGSNRGS